MPAFASHYILSDQILSRLRGRRPELAELLDRNRAAYNWGSQGPDLLYFYKIWNPKLRLADLGSLMHSEKTTELFAAFASYLLAQKGSEDYDALRAYFYGFLSHYYFDSLLHPYVYGLQQRRYESNPSILPLAHHNFIENGIDTLLYRRFYGKPITRLRTKKAFAASRALQRQLGGLYHALLLDVYRIDYDVCALRSCVGSASRLSRLLFDRSHYVLTRFAGLLSHIVPTHGLLPSLLHKKRVPEALLNDERNPWRRADTTQISRLSVLDLFEQACTDTLEAISCYDGMLSSGELTALPYRVSFSAGRVTDSPAVRGGFAQRHMGNRFAAEHDSRHG